MKKSGKYLLSSLSNTVRMLPRLALSQYYGKQGDFKKVVDIMQQLQQEAKGDFTYLKMLSEAQYRTGGF